MKNLVWLLVAINIGLPIYYNQKSASVVESKAALSEIHPEKIVILTQKDIDAMPIKAEEALAQNRPKFN